VFFLLFTGDGDPHRQQESEEGRKPFQITPSCGVSCVGTRIDAPPMFMQLQKAFPVIPHCFGAIFVIFGLFNVLFVLF
jgi:hypothetical protein